MLKIIERTPDQKDVARILLYASDTYEPGKSVPTRQFKNNSKVHQLLFFHSNIDTTRNTATLNFTAIYDPTLPFPLESLTDWDDKVRKSVASLTVLLNPLVAESDTTFKFGESKTYATYQPNIVVQACVHIIKHN
jgi:hypothetical protein